MKNPCIINPRATAQAQDIARRLADYEFGTFPIKNTIRIEADGGIVEFQFAMLVPDRVTGKMVDVLSIGSITADIFQGLKDPVLRNMLDDFVYRTIQRAMAHEVEEHLKRDGILVRDPHPKSE